MFSEVSGPYNSLEYLKYGGRSRPSLSKFASYARSHRPWNITRPTIRRAGSMDPWEGIYGGVARRKKPTKKQLAALAKGRAKLARMRKEKKHRRGGKAGKRKFSSDLSDFYRPKKMKISQDGVDTAALKASKIYNKLVNDYGIDDVDGFQPLPEVYKLVRVLNKLMRYLEKAEKLGYEPVYPLPEFGLEAQRRMANIQETNLESRARKGGDQLAMKNVIRKLLQQQGKSHTMADVNKALRGAKKGAFRDLMNVENTAIPSNAFNVKREDLMDI